MENVRLTIDDKPVEACEGEKILWAALDAGIWIPNLCAVRDRSLPFGGCRLCLVEVEGRRTPVASCSEPIAEGMVVHTRSEGIDRLVRTAFELLIAAHPVTCKTCAANKRCGLQEIARRRGLKLRTRRFSSMIPDLPIDEANPYFRIDPNKCVLCGKCVYICNDLRGVGAIDFIYRGIRTSVGTVDRVPIDQTRCDFCLECVRACPVGALALEDKQNR